MSGGADLFRVLSQTENVGPLVADTRPSLVVDRTGSRLLWANAAGAAFFGVTTIDKLTALRFASNSPFARRIATLDDMLVSSQDRIERLPLQRGLLPRPTVCKASRVTADGVKAILLTIVDGTGSFTGDPVSAFAALTATALPPAAETVAKTENTAAEPIGIVSDVVATDAAEPIETVVDAAAPDMPEPIDTADEITAEEAVLDLVADNTEAVIDAPLPEVAETFETVSEEASSESAEEDLAAEPDAVAEGEATAEEVEAEPCDADVEKDQAEPSADVETVLQEASSEPDGRVEAPEDTAPETAEPSLAEAAPEPAVSETNAEDVPPETVDATPEAAAPAFVFPTHGRPVRFVFELDPLLAFTFVSADLAATVGPGMADILGRTWSEVAGRLEFDPAGRIAEALGHRDTFTGLTVDWPVEGENLRVPADLAGMPVFGRERAFRGYRGFGVLKTGAAFEAPIPAEPIAASEPDEAAPLPPTESDATDGVTEEEVSSVAIVGAESAEQPVDDGADAPLVVDDVSSAEAVQEARAVEDAAAEAAPESDTPELPQTTEETISDALAAETPDASEPETFPSFETADETALMEAEVGTADEVAPEEPEAETADGSSTEADVEIADEPVDVASEADLSDITAATEQDLPDETLLADEEPTEADELVEPLPLVTPPEDVASDLADPELPPLSVSADEVAAEPIDPEPAAPSVSEVTSAPAATHRATFASLTGDKAKALSKPERDAFDKIAEALADAFGPRIMADPADRQPVHPIPVVSRQAETQPEIGPSVDVALLDKLPVALAILRGGDIIHANRAFLDLCGYPDVATIDGDGGFAQVFEGAALSRDAAIPAIRRRDGVEIPVSARLHSMPMDGGIASLLVVQETAAATSRDRLATAEQRAEDMEAILDTATDGVLVLDQKGLVIGANKSAEALFGNERSHMIGMAFVDLLAPESHRSALDYLDGLGRNALSSVLNDGREVIGRVAGGGLVPLFMTVGRVSPTKFCAVLRDITQWKRAEEELTSAKKAAENASSQKSDFLAKMSHEIRTPLNAIIGFSEVMMEERFGPVGNERYKEYLRDIHVSGTHIMSLVNDLLDLSKIEAGKLELTFEAVGLNDVVRECAALMQPQANRERIIIRTSLSSSLPPVVADNRSLRQIILNLLSNAVKFNSAGGQVIVSTLYEESGEVVLRVRDTGQGMSEGDIVKAMEPFRQLSTSRTGGGTGLGLPLTKALVEANRAAFQIDSTPGQGTMIQITFPSTRVLAE
ncbi:PAS domain S-box-containing protein [Pleomorphomonas diazotrophica]|nr:PAS domain-containing sensor histidine kinase [Pleomorphomonas diazotrophica]SFN15168.1 PAS domain S-box-containing protein [Pleomorphomonas diazotrophica]